MRDKDLERFWSFVDKRGDDEHWPWIKENTANSPMISINCKTVSALRMMWEIHYGKMVPSCMSLLRVCGAKNFECVNPRHMAMVKRGTTLKVWLARKRAARPNIHRLADMAGFRLVEIRDGRYNVAIRVKESVA